MNNKKISTTSVILLTASMIASNTVIGFADGIKKDETVYSILKNNGDVDENIVSTWIKGDSKLGEIKDKSELSNIKNLNGDEKPAIDGDNITWNVGEDDLYYRGESNKKLPIDVNIKYELDGKKVNSEDIQGKSGKIKMTISLKNNELRSVSLDGKDRDIYVPFMTATEVIMPRDNFKDINVNSGKVLDDGKNSDITFVSLPGFKESLELDEDLINMMNLKDTLIIEGETTNFKNPDIFIVATPNNLDLDEVNEDTKLTDLKNSLKELKDGGADLLSGAKQLSDGNSELSKNYATFDKGVKTLDNGADTLNSGIKQLNDGTSKLTTGANDLSSGLNQLNSSQGEFHSGVSAYTSSVGQLYNAYGGINTGIQSAYQGSTKLLEGINSGASGLDSLLASTDQIDDVASKINLIIETVNAIQVPKDQQGLKDSLLQKGREISGGLNQIAEGQRGGISQLKGGMGELAAGASTLNQGLDQLNSGSVTFYDNFGKLNGSSNTLNDGSKKLKDATGTIYDGSQTLSSGVNSLGKGVGDLSKGGSTLKEGTLELSSNSNKIVDGTNELSKGSKELYDGTKKLKEDGLDKLYDEGNKTIGELDGAMEVKDKMVEISKGYNNYGGISEGMEGNVKFVMKTQDNSADNKKDDKDKVSENSKEDSSGVKGWFKKLFNK